jgi:TDG/mug DNA glycosylase family protein
VLKIGIGFTDVCKLGAGMDHQALKSPVDIQAFRDKMLRYRPDTIAFTSKKTASLFYGRPTKAVALGRQPAERDFPVTFVLASPSGAASALAKWHGRTADWLRSAPSAAMVRLPRWRCRGRLRRAACGPSTRRANHF